VADTLTQQQRDDAIAFFASAAAKGANPATSAPATQEFLARWNEHRTDPDTGADIGAGYDFYKNPNFREPKPAAAPAAVTGSQYGTWEPDPANPGQYRQVVPPQAGISDPNEARSKAIKAQTDEADRDARIRNERATGLYVDDKELANVQHLERSDANAANTLKETIRNNTARIKAEDDKLHLDNQKFLQVELPKSTADIARIGAETGKIGAETDLTKAQIVALGIKTESDTARALAAGLLDKAQADKINFELKKPADVTGGAEQQYLLRRTPEGQLIQELNPNYQGPKAPTTRGELAQRVSTLQTQAQQMRDRIAADKSIPPDQQAARFNQWYDQNVAPQAGALEQQQQAIARDEAQKAMTAAATAISTTAPYRVGPNFASSFEQGLNRLANVHGGGKTPLDFTGSVGWKGPSIDQSVQQTLAPAPGMDFQSLLNRDQWAPGGGPVPAAGAVAGPAAAGPTPAQMANIAAAGQQTAAATNPANAPFGAIGANPMLAAMQARGGVPDPNAALRARQAADAALQQRQAQVGQPVPQQAPVPLPSATPMPLATGSGPLPYSTSTWRPSAPPAPTPPAPTTGAPGQLYGLVADAANPFASVIPYLPGYDPTQIQTQWDWPHLTPG
jgi:hypothetical protein